MKIKCALPNHPLEIASTTAHLIGAAIQVALIVAVARGALSSLQRVARPTTVLVLTGASLTLATHLLLAFVKSKNADVSPFVERILHSLEGRPVKPRPFINVGWIALAFTFVGSAVFMSLCARLRAKGWGKIALIASASSSGFVATGLLVGNIPSLFRRKNKNRSVACSG